MNSNHEVLEQVADAFVGETVKASDLIALVLQAKPKAKASAIFPAAADILSTAPSSAPYRKFLKKVGTGKYEVLAKEDRVDEVSAKKAVPEAPAPTETEVPAPTETEETEKEEVAEEAIA